MKAILDKLKLHRDGFPQTFTAEEVKYLVDAVNQMRSTLRTVSSDLSDATEDALNRIDRQLEVLNGK